MQWANLSFDQWKVIEVPSRKRWKPSKEDDGVHKPCLYPSFANLWTLQSFSLIYRVLFKMAFVDGISGLLIETLRSHSKRCTNKTRTQIYLQKLEAIIKRIRSHMQTGFEVIDTHGMCQATLQGLRVIVGQIKWDTSNHACYCAWWRIESTL